MTLQIAKRTKRTVIRSDPIYRHCQCLQNSQKCPKMYSEWTAIDVQSTSTSDCDTVYLPNDNNK